MLEKLVSWGRLLWDAGVKTDRNSQDINALQEQNQEFSEAFKLIVLQQEHDRQMNARRVESLEPELKGCAANSAMLTRKQNCVYASKSRSSCANFRPIGSESAAGLQMTLPGC